MSIRISKAAKEFNVTVGRIADFLTSKNHAVEANPNAKLDDEQYALLQQEFGADKEIHEEASKIFDKTAKAPKAAKPATEADTPKAAPAEPAPAAPAPEAEAPKATPAPAAEKAAPVAEVETEAPATRPGIKVVGHIDLDTPKPAKAEPKATKPATEAPKTEAPAPQAETPQTEASAPKVTPQAPKAEPVAEAPKTDSPAPKEEKTDAAPAENAGQGETNADGVFRLNPTPELSGPKVLGTIDLSAINDTTRPKKKSRAERAKERAKQAAAAKPGNGEKRQRTPIGRERVDVNAAANQGGARGNQGAGKGASQRGNQNNANQTGKRGKGGKKGGAQQPAEISDEDVAKQVKETLARLQNKQKGGKGAKYRKEKRDLVRQQMEEERLEAKADSKVLKLTEFVTANELAQMMDVPVTKVIGTCMSIGIMVSINQRMDAETIDLVAEEFGFKTEYISADVQEAIAVEEDAEEDLQPRAPIVTVMGHVDHGKTSLLDYIRKANVIAGEAGGITQHIGAYNVTLESGRHITFLDTPGHEAFTAMRARGAQVTDIAIIIIAADDDIMPQTKEAINHAVAAGVPIVFAINKIDKPHANPDKIKEGLAAMNFLVEEWGGKYQSQDISAKKGIGVNDLLEKVLLEADMLELKANPNRRALGTVIESSLDKGRGYVATVLVSNGTLRQGDVVLAGTNYGRVKALFNERNQRIQEIGPSQAATLLGFNGAPQAGDQFHVMETEQEAREIANKREQLQREQDLRTHKMLTLDEVGRRIKLGSFKEMNIIVKGDVDGSVEALSDSFIKLSTETIAVNVIHKGVGQISENDVTLAAASQAVIVGFQVRPSQAARKQAEHDGVDIRLYSIIYDAIEEVKEAMEGMLEPIIKEEVTATVEVRQVYHITKVGYVAGAYVLDGKVARSNKARLIRDGIVIFTGEIAALKRFKDDVKEVTTNFECGISLTNCNDIKEGDIIETFQEVEVKQKLS